MFHLLGEYDNDKKPTSRLPLGQSNDLSTRSNNTHVSFVTPTGVKPGMYVSGGQSQQPQNFQQKVQNYGSRSNDLSFGILSQAMTNSNKQSIDANNNMGAYWSRFSNNKPTNQKSDHVDERTKESKMNAKVSIKCKFEF